MAGNLPEDVLQEMKQAFDCVGFNIFYNSEYFQAQGTLRDCIRISCSLIRMGAA